MVDAQQYNYITVLARSVAARITSFRACTQNHFRSPFSHLKDATFTLCDLVTIRIYPRFPEFF